MWDGYLILIRFILDWQAKVTQFVFSDRLIQAAVLKVEGRRELGGGGGGGGGNILLDNMAQDNSF